MFDTRYYITSILRILHKLGMSVKTAQRVHTSKADIKEIRQWQRNANGHISRLEKKGFAIVIQDESLFTYDPVSGRKYWSSTDNHLFYRTTDCIKKWLYMVQLQQTVADSFECVTSSTKPRFLHTSNHCSTILDW